MRDELDIHDSIAVRDYMQEALNAAYVDLNVRIGKTYLDGECIELICVRSKTDKKDLPVVFDRYELGKKLKEQFPVEVYWEEKEKTDYANVLIDILFDDPLVKLNSAIIDYNHCQWQGLRRHKCPIDNDFVYETRQSSRA